MYLLAHTRQQLILSFVIIDKRKMPGQDGGAAKKSRDTMRMEARVARRKRVNGADDDDAEREESERAWRETRTRIAGHDSKAFEADMLRMNTRYVLKRGGATFNKKGNVTDGDVAAPGIIADETGNYDSHGLCYVHTMSKLPLITATTIEFQSKHKSWGFTCGRVFVPYPQ